MGYLETAKYFIKRGELREGIACYNAFKNSCERISHCIDYNLERIKNNLNYIVSLTSYPKRIEYVHLVVNSLLNQNVKNIQVVLWLAREEFPNKEDSIPMELKKIICKNFCIEWCNNVYSYNKLIPALIKYKDKIIITVDDDVIYPDNWLNLLLDSYINDPFSIHCHRGHKVIIKNGKIASYRSWPKRISIYKSLFSNFMTGVGGVLYPVGALHKNVINYKLFLNLCRYGDDIWFWAMSVLNNTKIRIIKNGINKYYNIEGTQEDNLYEENTIRGRNDIMISNVIKKYPQILVKLYNEENKYE